MNATKTTKTTFAYCTDAGSGKISAESLQDALEKIDARDNIMDCLENGAWAWVEGPDGDRLYIGRENMG